MMRFWRKPPPKKIQIYFIPESSDEGFFVAEQEITMGTIRLTLNYTVTKNGEDFNGGENWWAGLSDEDTAKMVALAGEVEDHVKKRAGKGGPLTVTLSARIDGANAPAGFLDPRSYSGLTLHGLNEVENQMQRVADKLLKMGKDHADKKGVNS